MLAAMRWNPFKSSASSKAAEHGTFEPTVIEDLPRGAFEVVRTNKAGESGIDGEAISTAPSIGEVGRYELKAVLGRGGLGTVYAAWDPLLTRPVAVKTLHRHLHQNPDAMVDGDEMLLNEARAAARLSHQHIVTIYDAGNSDLGVFIAMEPLRGQDMRHLLQQGWTPNFYEVAVLARRVADALAYAHGKGVIHCDIKPANIFLADRRHPKVLDFGIARMAQRDGSAIGINGAGSPHYLAPEQLRGEVMDRRCDVYSLGVVMFELLTGRPPYIGNSLEEITEAVVRAPQPLARKLNDRVPTALSAIAARAMSRAPDDRYPSARHLSVALRDWLDSDEALALQHSNRPPPRKWLVVSGLGVAAFGAAFWWQNVTYTAEIRSANAAAAAAAQKAASVAPVAPFPVVLPESAGSEPLAAGAGASGALLLPAAGTAAASAPSVVSAASALPPSPAASNLAVLPGVPPRPGVPTVPR